MVHKENPAQTRAGAGGAKTVSADNLPNQTITRDVITVIRDPNNPLGKRFSHDKATGKIMKDSAVSVSYGIAIQHYVPDVETLRDVLQGVSNDSHSAIINACFPLIGVGEQFLIQSESRFAALGVNRHDTTQTWPVEMEFDGKTYPALGRFKEHTAVSSWVLLDRDVDAHTPERFANMDYGEWLEAVNQLLPGVLNCARLHAQSSSARVYFNGEPQGIGNGHTWLKIANPDDLARMRQTIPAHALELGMAWNKPKHSRATGEIVGNSIATIIDWSVFTPGRLVFVGKPQVQQ